MEIISAIEEKYFLTLQRYGKDILKDSYIKTLDVERFLKGISHPNKDYYLEGWKALRNATFDSLNFIFTGNILSYWDIISVHERITGYINRDLEVLRVLNPQEYIKTMDIKTVSESLGNGFLDDKEFNDIFEKLYKENVSSFINEITELLRGALELMADEIKNVMTATI